MFKLVAAVVAAASLSFAAAATSPGTIALLRASRALRPWD
jgi:hypothetical protein